MFRSISLFTIAATLLLTSQPMPADFSRSLEYQPGDTSRYEQRQQYRRAVSLIQSGNRSDFQAYKEQLRTYPLYPYLVYFEHIQYLSRQKPEDIANFIEAFSDTPLAAQLRQNYLYSLGRRGLWQTFVDFYDRDARNTSVNQCHYGYALHKAGQTELSMQTAVELWLTDRSQPDECDPIFRVMRDNGTLTPELAWQRLSLAVAAGRTKLAAYLVRFISDKDKALANQYVAVHKSSRLIMKPSRYDLTHRYASEVIAHGIKRRARSSPVDALNILPEYAEVLAEEEQQEVLSYIGVQLARKGNPEGLLDDLPVNLHEHPDLVEARIRLALEEGDFSTALVMINLLPDDKQNDPVWRYWSARALDLSVDANDRSRAQTLYESLTNERTFYGFFSADKLNIPYPFTDEPLDITEEEILALETTPGIQRAFELLTLGERSRARREWRFVTRDFSRKEKRIAAHVATRWGWHKSAIQALIDAKAWNELELRFPLAYHQAFVDHARSADIPLNWSLAIARQESAFMPDARSSAGAMGLMQLMPATARIVASDIGTKVESNRDLTNPDFNIKLGSQYLGMMLRRYNNNRILASAAYNAGPGRVDRWKDASEPIDVWIETIPFRETRNYVQNVLVFATIYARHMGQPQPLVYPHEFEEFALTLTADAAETTNRDD